MSRVLGVVIVAALCAGCRNPTPVYDPFMGRTTIPPPGTAAAPPGQPYYAAPPAGTAPNAPPLITPPAGASAMPQRTIGPSNFGPSTTGGNGLSSTFTPNVSPVSQTSAVAPATAAPQRAVPGTFPTAPGAQPINATPGAVQPIYGPPGGGIVYPPAAMAPPASGNPTLAQAPAGTTGVPTPANPATDPAAKVKAANWESADSKNAAGSAAPVVFNSSQDRNAIRIVEPPAGAIAAAPKTSTTSAGTLSSGTLNQSLPSTRVPEITDLPPANSAAKAIPAAAQSTASSSPSTPAPGDPSYGYDPQYHWLKGKLEYSQSTHSWRLRYIPPDGNTDNYGGSVVLADNSQMTGMQSGDAVYAQGSLGANNASQGSYAPQYNLQQIRRL